MAVTKIKPIKGGLKRALDYIQNPDKTDEKILVSSFGCAYETAYEEFEFTLSKAMQKGNNLGHHLIQSFEPGESTPEQAHEIGRRLADEITKGRHEYVLTTHIDKGHVHNHLIFCAASFIDHKKYISNKRSYYEIRNHSDKLCKEYGLSVVIPGQDKGKHYAEYAADQTGGGSWIPSFFNCFPSCLISKQTILFLTSTFVECCQACNLFFSQKLIANYTKLYFIIAQIQDVKFALDFCGAFCYTGYRFTLSEVHYGNGNEL